MKSRGPSAVALFLLGLSIQVYAQQQTLTRCRNALDLIIAVDGSNSMGEPNFRLQTNSVSNMVNNLDVSQNNVHVGALLFSQEIDAQPIPLTFNKMQAVQGIRSWHYPDTETRTDLAIEEAMEMFQRDGRGGNVPQLLIVVTDGASTIPARTLAMANEAKRRGIQIYAVGVSGARNEVDMNELTAIASSPDMALLTPDFRTLENTLNNAAEQICVSLECGQAQIDMVFMLDSSSTVGPANFNQLKEFIVEFLFYAHIHVGNIRVGVMTYSDSAIMQFNMLRYIGNENGLNQAIRAIQYRPGGTNMAAAFKFAREQMYTVGNGDRQAAPDVLIVVSGSVANINAGQTITEAEATRAAGIQVYGLGVGLPNTRELDGVTSRPVQDNRFTVSGFDQLNSVIQPVYNNFNRFCANPPPVPACFMGQTDIWWVVDLSRTAERLSRFDFTNDFASLKNGLIEQINIALDPSVSNPGVRMGLVSYSDQAQRVINPSEQASVSRTAQAVSAFPGFIPVGGSNVVRALQQITVPPQQSRWNSYVAMVAPQSAFNNLAMVQNEINRLRQLGYTIVFFTVMDGSNIAPGQLANMGSGPQYFYFLNSYAVLEEATKNFTRDILCAPPPPFQPPTTTRAPVRGNGLCATTRYQQDGMDVLAHPRDCDKYVQCYYNQDTNMDMAVVRSCPMGLHWLQTRRECVAPREAGCQTDQCLEDCDAYKTEGACGAYWECNGRRSEFKCCRPMFAFRPGKGCTFDPTCQDQCEAQTWCGLCQKRPNYRMPYGYDVLSGGNQGNQVFPVNQAAAAWSPRHCDYSYFDVVTCDCTKDMNTVCPPDRSFNFRDAGLVQQIQSGSVSGVRVKDMNPTGSGLGIGPNSELHVDVNKGERGEPFSVVLRFSEGQAFNPYGQVILTSGMNCGEKRGLVVNADDRFITAQAYSRDGQKVMVSVPYQGIAPTEFKNLGISYAKGMLTLSVVGRNHQYIAQSKAPVDICFSCGIDIGAALNKQSISSGQVESISVHSCEIQDFSN